MVLKTLSTATETRLAADAASVSQFDSLPVDGVGSETWRRLWESARRFSDSQAYPDNAFPYLGEEVRPSACVLCHQDLGEDAKKRLSSFEAFVAHDTERIANDAENEHRLAIGKMQNLRVLDTETELDLQRTRGFSEAAHVEIREVLDALEVRRRNVEAALQDVLLEVPKILPAQTLTHTAELIESLDRMQADLDGADPETQLAQLRAERAELLGRRQLADSRELVDSRISHLKELSVLDAAIRSTDTRGITRRAAELTRTHVSDVMKHHFSQETLRLNLKRVRLADAGGGHGNLRHRAQLVDAVQPAPLREVLSEGEQTALGLAGFLTEVETDHTGSAVIFDDPVTSLDHVRQECVARRIAELATRRQVIIFTHDIGFMVDLKRAAEAAAVDISEKWVSKVQAKAGRVSEGSPWDSKTVAQRLNSLRERLSDIKSIYEDADPAKTHEAARSWYADLRLIWERAIEEIVLGPVLVRGRLELRPTYLKVFVQFSAADNQQFQTAFTHCGDRGSHDRSSQLNRPLPAVSELEADLEALREWHKRVKAYANK